MRNPLGRAILCILLSGLSGPLLAAEETESYRASFESLDAQLRQGDWEGARTASLERIQETRLSLVASDLAGAVARLALAEAGLGRQEDALWHWHIAQNIDRNVLSGATLAAYGPPGELLARNLLRRQDEAPGGWTVLQPTGGVQSGRKLEGEIPKLSTAVAAVAAPKGLKIQAVIDAEGRLREPVLVSGSLPGMIWEVLEGIRSWRYEPARKGAEKVAVFRNLTLNPPAAKPLAELVHLSQRQMEVEALLRSGNWQEGVKRARKTWIEESNDSEPTRTRMAAALVLRALAEAGTGETDSAICRWQAAQHIHDALYDLDLAPYGTAGELLARHRWGSVRMDGAAGDVRAPEIARKSRLTLPAMFRRARMRGVVVLSGIVDAKGALRQPVVVRLFAPDRIYAQAMMSTSMLGGPDIGSEITPWLLSISALDSFCDWRFKPATADGKAVAYQQVVSIPYNFNPTMETPELKGLLTTGYNLPTNPNRPPNAINGLLPPPPP